MQLTRPELRFGENPFLAAIEAERIFITGDFHIRSKEEVQAIEPEWENAVLRLYTLFKYHRDAPKIAATFGININGESIEAPEE